MTIPFDVSIAAIRCLGTEVASTFPEAASARRAEAVARALGYRTRASLLAEAKAAPKPFRRGFDGAVFAAYAGSPGRGQDAEDAACRVAVDWALPSLPPEWRAALGEDRGRQFRLALPFLANLEPNQASSAWTFVGRVALCCGLEARTPLRHEAVLAAALHVGIAAWSTENGVLLSIGDYALTAAETRVSRDASTADVLAFIDALPTWDSVVATALLFGGVDRARLSEAMGVSVETVEDWTSGKSSPASPDEARKRLKAAVDRERRVRPAANAPTTEVELLQAPAFDGDTTDKQEVATRVARAMAWALERKSMPVFTVYDRPHDAPDWWVVRLFLGEKPTTFHYLASELVHARGPLERLGLTPIARQPGDQDAIAETWI